MAHNPTDPVQVKAIQDEYQGYMERVRGVAQGAIDAANNGFQAARHAVTGRLDAAVHQLQARFFSAPVRPPLACPGFHSGVMWARPDPALKFLACQDAAFH